MDVLADRLARARAQGALFAHSTLRGRWGLDLDDTGIPLSLHAVLGGEVRIEAPGLAAATARGGEVVLLRGRGPYRFRSKPGAPVLGLAAMTARHGVAGVPGRVVMPGPGPETEIICGAYTFAGTWCDALLGALPAVAVVPVGDERLRATLHLLEAELGAQDPGRQVVLDRLLDLVLVACLRALWSAPGAEPPPWFSALGDPVAGPALRALHARPAEAWTVAALGREAGVSRAVLARRFAATVGVPPLTYLTRWRMQLAREALGRPGATLASVAHEVGYASEFAFAVAFKREVGEPPGRWARRAA